MLSKTRFITSSCAFAIVGVLLLLPSANTQANFSPFPQIEKDELFNLTSASSASTAKTKIEYESIKLSDLNESFTGDLGEAEITIPVGIRDKGDYILLTQIKGYLKTTVVENDELWLDEKNNFIVNAGGETSTLESLLKKNKSNKVKKEMFQGSKKTPILTASSEIKDIGVFWQNSPGKITEIYYIFIFDPISSKTLMITLVAPKESSKLTKQIWDKLLKSVTEKKKKSNTNSKNKTSNSILNSTAYQSEYFSIKAPKGWVVTGENDDVDAMFLAPNLGAVIVIITEDIDEKIDYDPDLKSIWLNSFLEELEATSEDFEFKSSEDIIMDGIPGLRINYSDIADGVKTDGYQLITIKNGIIYIITVGSQNKTQLKKYEDVITKSIATFKRKR